MTTPAINCAENGNPRLAMSPAGRTDRVKAMIATADVNAQLNRNDSAVRPRFAARRSRFHAASANIGTAVSSSAANAMIARMIVTLVRKSRAVIVVPSTLMVIVEGLGARRTDKYLTSASDVPLANVPYATVRTMSGER